MCRRIRVRRAVSRRVSAVEAFRVQRDARTGVRASDAILGRSVKLVYDKGEEQ